MSNQPNENYADKETLDAIKSLKTIEDKLDKALYVEFGVGEGGAGLRGLSGQPITIAYAVMLANGHEKRINEKSELLTTLRKAPAHLKISVQTIANRVAAADWGVE